MQRDWSDLEQGQSYVEYVRRIRSQAEAQSAGRVAMAFNSDYQELVINGIDIWRGKTLIDALQAARMKLTIPQ